VYRLFTTAVADKILILEEEAITKIGSHESHLKIQGKYAETLSKYKSFIVNE